MMDAIISVPISFRLADQTPEAQLAAQSIGSEWVQVGQSMDEKLYIVTCRTSLEEVEQLILDHSLAITIRHAQASTGHDEYDEVTQEAVHVVPVYLNGVAADLLQFMPDVVTYDDQGNKISRTPATEVNIGIFAGHEPYNL